MNATGRLLLGTVAGLGATLLSDPSDVTDHAAAKRGISGETGSKTTLEQIFLSIVGQDGTERPQLEELSWLM